MQCYTDIIFFHFSFSWRKSPIIMGKNDIQAGDFTSKHKQRWFLIGQICLSLSCGKIQAKKTHQKNTNIFTQKISLRRFIYWFIFYALFEEERAYCFVAVCRAVWTIYWLQNIFKCYSVTQNRLCTVYYLKEILMFQLGYLFWGSAPPTPPPPPPGPLLHNWTL